MPHPYWALQTTTGTNPHHLPLPRDIVPSALMWQGHTLISVLMTKVGCWLDKARFSFQVLSWHAWKTYPPYSKHRAVQAELPLHLQGFIKSSPG